MFQDVHDCCMFMSQDMSWEGALVSKLLRICPPFVITLCEYSRRSRQAATDKFFFFSSTVSAPFKFALSSWAQPIKSSHELRPRTVNKTGSEVTCHTEVPGPSTSLT